MDTSTARTAAVDVSCMHAINNKIKRGYITYNIKYRNKSD